MNPFPPFDPDLQFSEQFLHQVNQLSARDALALVDRSLLQTATMHDRYMHQLMNMKYDDPQFAGVQHCWWIDCNNILRLKKLHAEIESEL